MVNVGMRRPKLAEKTECGLFEYFHRLKQVTGPWNPNKDRYDCGNGFAKD